MEKSRYNVAAEKALVEVAEAAKRFLSRLALGFEVAKCRTQMASFALANPSETCDKTIAIASITCAEKAFGILSHIEAFDAGKTLWAQNPSIRRALPEVGFLMCGQVLPGKVEHLGIVIEVDSKYEWFRTVEGDVNKSENSLFVQHRTLLDPGNLQVQGFLKPF